MIWEYYLPWLLLGLAIGVLVPMRWFSSERRALQALAAVAKGTPSSLDVVEYKLGTEVKEGFTIVTCSFLTSDGCAHPFEFPPGYAYVLSNELLKVSVLAAPKARPQPELVGSSDDVVIVNDIDTIQGG